MGVPERGEAGGGERGPQPGAAACLHRGRDRVQAGACQVGRAKYIHSNARTGSLPHIFATMRIHLNTNIDILPPQESAESGGGQGSGGRIEGGAGA